MALAWPPVSSTAQRPTPTPQQVVTPSNRKAHQVVDAAIAALGGERYLQANQLIGRGHLYSFNSAGQLADAGTEFWLYQAFPDRERIELTKHRDVIYIYAAGKGWEITFRGVAPLLNRQVADYHNLAAHSLDVILKTWAQDPHTLMLDQGLNNYDQNQVETVQFTAQNGDNATVDFSVVTQLPMRVQWRRSDPDTGGHFSQSVVYGNWASIGGVETPFSLDRYQGPQRTDQRFFDQISYAPFPDSVFTPKPLKK